jgi:transposase
MAKIKIKAATVKGSIFDTDEFVSDKDLSRYGKHVPIDHGEAFAFGPAHINGIEGFWSYAKRLHRLCHGVDRDNFPVYLAEYEFRYNHRDEHLLSILFNRLYIPNSSRDACPKHLDSVSL